MNSLQFGKWLALEVLGKILRKSPAKERRGPVRDAAYLNWIRTLPCTACGIEGRSEAAHTGRDGGLSRKAGDLSCVPLCADCHTMRPDSYHRIDGGRRAFERRYRVSFAREVKRLNAEWRELTRVA